MKKAWFVVQLVGFWGFWLLLTPIMVVAQPEHDRAFWQGIAKNHYAVPSNESANVLANELSSLLASPDPELRDDLAYSILARWIYRDLLSQSTLIALTDSWQANLRDGMGETGTNSVLKRSFSALCLASMARREPGLRSWEQNGIISSSPTASVISRPSVICADMTQLSTGSTRPHI